MQVGASIGPYRVLRKIGEGGMGAVFLGEHTLIGRHAAIKVLLPELSALRHNVDRFFNEARATTAVSDPGIVQVFDFGFSPDQTAFIVMEYLEGEQLDVRLQRLGALTPVEALRITRQVAGSLAAAHAVGIVHRDLKPDNLFMIRDADAPGGERPKILDFGIAKLGDDTPNRPSGVRAMVTRTGQVIGTPVYMSPEQCDGAASIDHRADIYSLGCVVFQMLTGRPPFDVPGLGAVISAHLREAPPTPSSLAPHLPPGIDEVVLRCLAKSPDDRFATMTDLQQACDAILVRIVGLPLPRASAPVRPLHEHPKTTLGTSAGQRFGGAARRRVGLWAGVAALGAAVGITTAIITTHGDSRVSSAAVPIAPPPAPGSSVPQEVVAPADAAAPIAVEHPEPVPVAERPGGLAAPPNPPAAVAHKPIVVTKPAAKPPSKPKAKPTEDLYDDRN